MNYLEAILMCPVTSKNNTGKVIKDYTEGARLKGYLSPFAFTNTNAPQGVKEETTDIFISRNFKSSIDGTYKLKLYDELYRVVGFMRTENYIEIYLSKFKGD